MLHKSQMGEQKSNSIKNSSTVSQNHKQISKSSIRTKSPGTQQCLNQQIVQLKEKAHQSFMQVIQMQQLHEQQLEQLRSQYIEKQNENQAKIANLDIRIKQLQFQNMILQKNSRQHICDIDMDDFEIDNVELITCRDESSKLDDSSIINFQEIININTHQEKINSIKEEIKAEIVSISGSDQKQLAKINIMIQKMFDYVTFLKQEYIHLHQKNMEIKREYQSNENKIKSSKHLTEAIQKETKFMTENIKRISTEKMKVEKKLQETERTVKHLQDKIKKIESFMRKQGINVQEEFYNKRGQQHDKSLDLNEFIQTNFLKISQSPKIRSSSGLLRKTK